MELAEQHGIRLAVLHLATGSYPETLVSLFRPVLWKCSRNPQLFVFSTHSYFVLVPSSGAPTKGEYPYIGIQPGEWPTGIVGRWHAGREQFIWDECLRADGPGGQILPFPLQLVTEGGGDRLDEGGQTWVAKWLAERLMTPPYTTIRGWRSYWAQWRSWYDFTWKVVFGESYSPGRVYWRMIAYLRDVVFGGTYKGVPKNVAGYLIFGWWNSGKPGTGEDWDQFRVDNDPDFRRAHEESVAAQTPPTPVPDPAPAPAVPSYPTPFPANLGEILEADLVTSTGINLRAGTSTKHQVYMLVVSNARVRVYRATETIANGYTWYVVEHAKFRGWMALVGNRPFEAQFREIPPPDAEYAITVPGKRVKDFEAVIVAIPYIGIKRVK
jgi:hypothetical protein